MKVATLLSKINAKKENIDKKSRAFELQIKLIVGLFSFSTELLDQFLEKADRSDDMELKQIASLHGNKFKRDNFAQNLNSLKLIYEDEGYLKNFSF